MKATFQRVTKQQIIWIIIVLLAIFAVILRTQLQKEAVQSADLPNPVVQMSITPNFSQTVEQIYANANMTLTAIYKEATPIATPTLSETREAPLPANAQPSSLIEEVQPGNPPRTPTPSRTLNGPNPPQNTAANTGSNPSATAASTLNPTPTPSDQPTEAGNPTEQTLPPTPTPGSASCTYQANQAFETSLFVLINQLRASSNLYPLEMDESLHEIAFQHSEDMACKDFYDHIGSDGSDFLDRLHAANLPIFARATELLYVGRGEQNSPESAFEAWLSGPSSQSQLTYPAFNRVGIGYVYKEDSSYGGYFTLILLAVPPENE